MLKDEEHVNDVTEMLPVWTVAGRKELSDSRNVQDWIKYNIRAQAINYSKKKAKEIISSNASPYNTNGKKRRVILK